MAAEKVHIVGIGDDGVEGMTAQARRLVEAAEVLLGLGISDGAQAATVAEVADGVIVGSAVVRRQLEGTGPAEVGAFVASLRAGLDAS